MSTTDTERYVRITMLTFEGGLLVSRKVLQREVDRSGGSQTLDGLLLSKRPFLNQKRTRGKITDKQFGILFPVNGNTVIEEWDLTLVIKVINFLFNNVLSGQDVYSLNEILRIRNEVVCHATQPSLKEHEFSADWADLETCIRDLASNIDTDTEEEAADLMEKLRTGPLDLQSSIDRVAQLCRNDELMGHILTCMTQLDRGIHEVKSGVATSNTKIDGLLEGVRKLTQIVEASGEDESRVKIPIVNSTVSLSGENDVVQLARNILLKVLQSAVNNVQNLDDEDSVKDAVGQFWTECKRKGFIPISAESGSIILKIQCYNLQGLENMLRLCKAGGGRHRLVGIERALSTLFQSEVKLELLLLEKSIAILEEWIAITATTMAESAALDVSLSTGSDSTVPEESLSTGQEAVFDITCAPCSAEGYHYEAERYCRDCREHLCGHCVRDHETVRSLKRHKLFDIAKDVKNMSASHVADINVRSSSNKKNCWIYGMAVVADDKVVAADFNNDAVKLIDTTNNTIVSEHKPASSPWDVTTCNNTVAATLPLASKLVFLKHAEGLVHDREISVNGDCRGIEWYDDKLYVIFNEQKKLEVMTPAGVVLQTFSCTVDGHQLFQDPLHVSVNATNQRIYVSEYWQGHVVVLDLAGNQTGTYKDGKLGWPGQFAVDDTGVMFLCDEYNNSVHLLSPAGKKVKILLSKQDELFQPSSVCYCENTGRLYVGMCGRDNIKVFNLKKMIVIHVR